jgi:hypothetical protein
MPFAEPLPNSGLVSREFETGDAGRPDSVQDGLTAGALRLERHPLDAEWECGSVMASATPAIRQQRVVPSSCSRDPSEISSPRPFAQVSRSSVRPPTRPIGHRAVQTRSPIVRTDSTRPRVRPRPQGAPNTDPRAARSGSPFPTSVSPSGGRR